MSIRYNRKTKSYLVTVVNYLEPSRKKQKCVAKVKIFSLYLQATVERNNDTLFHCLNPGGYISYQDIYTPLNGTSVVTVFFRKVFLLLLSLISTVESSGLKIRLNCLNDNKIK